jgi:hypothetical protein
VRPHLKKPGVVVYTYSPHYVGYTGRMTAVWGWPQALKPDPMRKSTKGQRCWDVDSSGKALPLMSTRAWVIQKKEKENFLETVFSSFLNPWHSLMLATTFTYKQYSTNSGSNDLTLTQGPMYISFSLVSLYGPMADRMQ